MPRFAFTAYRFRYLRADSGFPSRLCADISLDFLAMASPEYHALSSPESLMSRQRVERSPSLPASRAAFSRFFKSITIRLCEAASRVMPSAASRRDVAARVRPPDASSMFRRVLVRAHEVTLCFSLRRSQRGLIMR